MSRSSIICAANASAILSFGAEEYQLPDTISPGENLIVPITIESLTAHNLPSGTGFNREAWVEIIVYQDLDTIYTSGLIHSNIEELDRLDSSLLLFTSYLLDENADLSDNCPQVYLIKSAFLLGNPCISIR